MNYFFCLCSYSFKFFRIIYLCSYSFFFPELILHKYSVGGYSQSLGTPCSEPFSLVFFSLSSSFCFVGSHLSSRFPILSARVVFSCFPSCGCFLRYIVSLVSSQAMSLHLPFIFLLALFPRVVHTYLIPSCVLAATHLAAFLTLKLPCFPSSRSCL